MGSSDEEDEVHPSSPTILVQHEDVPLPEEEPDPPPENPRSTLVKLLFSTVANKLYFQDTTIEGFTVPWPIQTKWMMLAASITEEDMRSMTPLESVEHKDEIQYLQSLKRKDKMLSLAKSLLEQLVSCQVQPATILDLNPTSPRYENARKKFNSNHSELNLANPEISQLEKSYNSWWDDKDRESEAFHKTRVTTWTMEKWSSWRFRIRAGKVLESLNQKKSVSHHSRPRLGPVS